VALLEAASALEAASSGLDWAKVRHIRASTAPAVALARELGVSDTLIRKVRRGELWNGSAGPRNRNDIPRRAVIETLLLAGLRASELCGLDGEHLDLAGGRLRVPREVTKTDAGERLIPLLPALRERLGEHRAAHAGGLGQPAFATRTGRRNTPNNVLNRVIVPAREKANELLAAQGRPPIAHLTPHTLRRTFASLLAVCNVPPRRAMYLLGHTDAKLTLSVYQQVLDMGPGSVELIEQVLGSSLDEARDALCGHAASAGVLVVNA
jgi:integrase